MSYCVSCSHHEDQHQPTLAGDWLCIHDLDGDDVDVCTCAGFVAPQPLSIVGESGLRHPRRGLGVA